MQTLKISRKSTGGKPLGNAERNVTVFLGHPVCIRAREKVDTFRYVEGVGIRDQNGNTDGIRGENPTHQTCSPIRGWHDAKLDHFIGRGAHETEPHKITQGDPNKLSAKKVVLELQLTITCPFSWREG